MTDSQHLDAVIPYEREYLAFLGDSAKISSDRKQLTANCPFHADTTHSLSVELTTGKFTCHACGATGNYISFLAKKMGVSTSEAYKQICRKWGVERKGTSRYDTKAYGDEKHFSPAELAAWGITDSENGRSILIPYKDASGQVVAVQYRCAPTATNRFFWKKGGSHCLYGENRLAAFASDDFIILVEGVSDTQTLWVCGLPGIGVPGANAFRKEDAAKLLPFSKIVIHSDGDKASDQFIEKVNENLFAAGYQGMVAVIRCGELGYKDPSELYVALGAEEAKKRLQEMIDRADFAPVKATAAFGLTALSPDLRMPSGYHVTENGVFQSGEERDSRVSYTPLAVTGIIEAEGNEMLEIALYVRGAWKRISAAKTDIFSAQTLVKLLSANGCDTPQGMAGGIMHYVSCFEAANPALPITKTATACGWIDAEHFLPYGADDWRLSTASGNGALARALTVHGNLQQWRDFIAPLRRNTVFRFILASSFAAPLLEPIGIRSFFVYAWCTSGKGKTAALYAALSVWGKAEDLVTTYNATTVGLERRVSYLNGLPLAIDERQIAGSDTASQRRLETEIYNLANGVGRIRGTRDGGLQETAEWKTVVLSTGEQPMITSSTQDGASNRTVELSDPPFDDGSSPGAVYGFVGEHYGHAGAAYIKTLIAMGWQTIRASYQDFLNEIKALIPITNGSHINDLTVAALADYLASRAVFGESESDARAEALGMVKAIAQTIEQASRRDVNMEALDAINAWIAANVTRFVNAPVGSATDEQYGAIYGFFQSLDEICIFPNVFRQMLASAGFNEDKTLRFMREKGLIKTEASKNTVKRVCKNLDFSGRVVCICKERFLAFLNATPPSERGSVLPITTAPEPVQAHFEPVEDDDELPF